MLFKTLKIVGKRYKIIIKEEFEDCGQCDDAKQTLTIQKGMPKDLELDTLIHEITHAIDYQMDLKMNERQVHGVGTGLAAVLMDNPKLTDYILSVIKDDKDDQGGLQ